MAETEEEEEEKRGREEDEGRSGETTCRAHCEFFCIDVSLVVLLSLRFSLVFPLDGLSLSLLSLENFFFFACLAKTSFHSSRLCFSAKHFAFLASLAVSLSHAFLFLSLWWRLVSVSLRKIFVFFSRPRANSSAPAWPSTRRKRRAAAGRKVLSSLQISDGSSLSFLFFSGPYVHALSLLLFLCFPSISSVGSSASRVSRHLDDFRWELCLRGEAVGPHDARTLQTGKEKKRKKQPGWGGREKREKWRARIEGLGHSEPWVMGVVERRKDLLLSSSLYGIGGEAF